MALSARNVSCFCDSSRRRLSGCAAPRRRWPRARSLCWSGADPRWSACYRPPSYASRTSPTCSTRGTLCSPTQRCPGPAPPHDIRRGSSCTLPLCRYCEARSAVAAASTGRTRALHEGEKRATGKKQQRLRWGTTEVVLIFRHTPTQFANC